ncbi:MAG: hypothetical protein LBJ23_06180 [Tannerella sp.]|nr:hypothetical protein [Tannerella sp.]
MKLKVKLFSCVSCVFIALCICACKQLGNTAKSYHFDENGVSREVLENYLERAITQVYFLMPNVPGRREGRNPYYEDDVRMIKNIGAKFIGRAIYRWGGESLLNSPEFQDQAKRIIGEMHEFDPDIVFQACLFEIITTDVNGVPIPDWVFAEFGLPVEERNFSYEAMLNENGRMVDHWRENSSVPDITRTETQMWFYFLAGYYINLGCEAFHIGQVELIGMNDPDKSAWAGVIARMRQYAKAHAPHHWVIIDAHVPYGGMVKDGVSLLDFNSFPLRVKEVLDKPYEGMLEVDYLDGIYNKSRGCTTPSGWSCEHLPYLVEFDNFGRSSKGGNVSTVETHFIWGWDEISWLSLQPEAYRNDWIRYAWDWIKKTDPNGHLQMPGGRMITCPNETDGNYRANTKSEACPVGYSQEETIKQLWGN